MKKLVPFLFLLSCTSEYGYHMNRDHLGTPNPPALAEVWDRDEFLVGTIKKTDILWVIDDSCSMHSKQEPLSENADDLMAYLEGTGWDYHVGIVDTDVVHNAGWLHEIGDDLWIDPDTVDAVDKFAEAAMVGTWGYGRESGFDATWHSIETEGPGIDNDGDGFFDGANCYFDDDGLEEECFFRNDASFHVVAISDENDQSTQDFLGNGNRGTTPDFVAWMKSLKVHEDLVSFSVIGWGNTSKYENAADELSGIKAGIFADDWTIVLENLVEKFTSYTSHYLLTNIPIEDTIGVIIERADGGFDFLFPGPCESMCYEYNPIKNGIELIGYTPVEDDRVIITYKPKAEN